MAELAQREDEIRQSLGQDTIRHKLAYLIEAEDLEQRWRPADGGKASGRGLPMTDATRLA
jgi:hypothetical protein